MSYEIETRDGIVLRGIPDDIPPDHPSVKSKVQAAREVPQPGMQTPAQPQKEGMFSQFMRGVYELPRTVLEVPTALASGLVAPIAGSVAGMANAVTSGNFGTPQGATDASRRAAEVSHALTYEPRAKAAQDIVGGVNRAIGAVAPGLPAVMGEMGAFAARPNIPPVPRETPKPSIRPEVSQAAEKFQNLGGKVMPHTLSDNKMVRMTGDWVENLPLSGSPNAANKIVINKELLRQIGGEESAGLLTPASFAPAMDKAGKTIGEMYGKVTVPYDAGLNGALDAIISRQRKHTPDIEKQVIAYVDDIRTKATENRNNLPGSTVRELDTELGTRIRSTTDGDLKGQLSDIQEALRDSLEKRLTPQDIATLRDARAKYAKGKLLEPLVAKNNLDGVPPSQLIARQLATSGGRHRLATEAAGEMGELAIIGNKFMNDTSSRYRGVLGNAGAVLMAIPGVVAGNAYNRIGPAVSRGKVAEAMKSREGLGYESAKVTPDSTLAIGDQAWRGESPFERPPVQDSGLMSLADMAPAQGKPDLTMGAIDYPTNDPKILTNQANYARMRRDKMASDEAIGERLEAMKRAPTGRGTALELGPNGKLRVADQGMKGATPDVIASTGHELNAAVDKLSKGFGAGLSATEKIAWDKAKVDLASVSPVMRGLTDRQIAGKMMDREWVAQTIQKARDKAKGFDEISKRAKDADSIRKAVAEREKMLDFAEAMEEKLRTPR